MPWCSCVVTVSSFKCWKNSYHLSAIWSVCWSAKPFTKPSIGLRNFARHHSYLLSELCVSWWSDKINSLWPSDTIWWHGSGSTLAQVMACCLTAPSHYLNQCWPIIRKVLWHSLEEMFNIFVLDVSFKFHDLRLQPHLPGANELNARTSADKVRVMYKQLSEPLMA